ncbi:High affinity cGMP-specific 3' [Schistosoma japonicum]|nr:High affinity cGMP-specific 3' [Schistosoma japonicum]
MFKRLIRCHVKPSRTPTPNKDGTHNNKSNIPTKCTAWLFSTISSSSSKIITNNGTNEANKNTGTCLEDSSQKEDNCNETRNITTNFQHPNDSWRISCMPYCPDPDGIKLPFIHFTKVRNQFLAIRSLPISSSIKEQLKSHTFNNWLYSDAELINFVKFMFMDLNLPESCHFSTDILENWLFSTYSRYNNVPFHNFKHAFMVTQMVSNFKFIKIDIHFSGSYYASFGL